MRRGLIKAGVLLALAAGSTSARADDAACVDAAERSLTLRTNGALKETLKQLQICSAPACPAEVKEECARRIESAAAAMPTLILEVKDNAGNDRVDVLVSIDGAVAESALDGRALSLDPGKHEFQFEVQGAPPVVKTFVLREGEKDRREVVVVAGPPTEKQAPPPPPPASTWSTRKTLALASGGIGVVGLGIGTAFWIFAASAQSKEKSDCSIGACANRAEAGADYDTANKDATGSTIAFIAGGAFVAAGAVLWFTAPKSDGTANRSASRFQLAPRFTRTGGGIVFGGDL